MRYISDIIVGGKSVGSYSSTAMGKKDMFAWKDTEGSDSGLVSADEAGWLKALGLCWHVAPWNKVVAVKHSHKTAMLHKYLKRVSTQENIRLGDMVDGVPVDVATKGDIFEENGAKNLKVLNWGNSVSVNGPYGSVVRNGFDIMTVYDLLLSLCRDTKPSVMKYNTIFVVEPSSLRRTTIELAHSIEAERFYAKMLLEV